MNHIQAALLAGLASAALLTGCSQPTPPPQGGSEAPPPAASEATPPGGSEATPPAGSEPGSQAAAPGGSEVAAAGGEGKTLYDGTCQACHGPDGKGVQGLGKDLVSSPMMKQSDKDLIAFIDKGRDTSDPANTTGVAMPPKGGNPSLTDDQLQQIVTYVRTLK